MKSPIKSSEGTSPADTSILAQWDSCQDSYLQNYEIINPYCFKPLIYGYLLQQEYKTNDRIEI